MKLSDLRGTPTTFPSNNFEFGLVARRFAHDQRLNDAFFFDRRRKFIERVFIKITARLIGVRFNAFNRDHKIRGARCWSSSAAINRRGYVRHERGKTTAKPTISVRFISHLPLPISFLVRSVLRPIRDKPDCHVTADHIPKWSLRKTAPRSDARYAE